MNTSAACMILILSPILPWLLKVTLSYKIRYPSAGKRIDRFFRKNKTSFLRRFLYLDFKQKIHPLLFWSNISAAIVLLMSVITSTVFLVLLLWGYRADFINSLVDVVCYCDLAIALVLISLHIFERLDGHR